MIYLRLFISFLQIGLFSIGGGYAAMPLIKEQIVDINGWLTLKEFTDLVTIAEMTPGPIAINAASFVGNQIGGILGSVVATLGCVIPSYVIVLSLAWIYFRYKNLSFISGVLEGLSCSSGINRFCRSIYINPSIWGENGFSLNLSDINIVALILFLASLFTLRKWKVSPIYIMLGTGFVGMFIYMIIE